MLTFELADDNNRLEIYGDKEGFLKLAKLLTGVAEEKSSDYDHVHLLTKDWGGGETLTDEKQCFENTLLHHVKIYFPSNK